METKTLIITTDTPALRRFARLALIALLLLPIVGLLQSTHGAVRFLENGQPTRTGPDAGMFPDTPTRTKLDLNGSWNCAIDGTNWRTVAVPSAYDFTGKVTFQRMFDVKSEMLDKYAFSLVAYGINYQCEVFINGNFVARHAGGYSSFVVPISPNTLQVGPENAIKVTVDNILTPKTTIPLRQQVGGWRTYGGIFRDIYILATPKLFIDDANIHTDITTEGKTGNQSAKISVQAYVTDRGADLKIEQGDFIGLQIEAYDKLAGTLACRSGITPITPQANKTISVSADAIIPAPKLWSPETPDLYVLKCQIVRVVNKDIALLDEFDINIGVRSLAWKDGRLYINNNLTPLKGVIWYEDHVTFGSAMSHDALERDVALMKTLGANLVRFPYPPHPYMLNLCDRYGLLAMEEVPLVDVPAEILSKDYYQELAATYAKEMVDRDKSHVSVLAWGIGEEFESAPSNSCEYVNGMRNTIKSIDDRSVYFTTHRVKDACFDYVDLIALDSYGDQPRDFRDVLKQCRANYPEKPIVVARYGRDIEPGNHNGYSDPLSMESQARYAMQFINLIQDTKIAGGAICSFNDWRADRAALTTHSHDPYLHTMGLVSYEREKRTAFDVVRALFHNEKVQALPIGNYSSNAPIIFVVAGFAILISFAFVYNANHRFRDAVNRSLFRTYNFFADVRDQRLLTYGQSIFVGLIVSLTWATMLASIFTYYRDNLLLDNLLSQFMTDSVKESFIRLVWSPPEFIAVVTGLIFVLFVVIAFLVKILSMTVRAHVYFYHAFAITMWSLLPFIVLIPVAMVLFRLMDSEMYVLPVFGLMGLVSLWVLFRLLKGISIIYDIFPVKVYAIGLLIIIVMSAAVYGYLDYTKSTTAYLKYMMQTMKNSSTS